MAKRILTALLVVLMAAWAAVAYADDCLNRGQLDEMYCDGDNDLVADSPKDPSQWKDPSTLVFTYTPVEDPAVYKDAFADFQAYLEKATGKRVVYYTVQSNAAEVEAMRSGRLHIAGFSTGPTGFAVNLAGYVPMAVKGYADGFQGYNLIMIVRKDSPYQKMEDLKGKVVAHTSASSNSGNLAPRALFPKLGLVPDEDYRVVYSGKHDQSVMGVAHGDYDAAPVASDVFERMAAAGRINKDDFRVIFRSPKFPTSSFGYAHDLKPELVQKIVGAFHTYRFPPAMQKTFKGADRFYPVTYMADWQVIRDIAEATGTAYNKAGLKKMAEKEAAKAKK
ncbi:phosphonate transport system substrate-binding protein [Desulfobaculum xiamenense]|uniref:Phosphonate transport system substrate-binding protein n=1 Tax=Desulfobaculum xiamenense TaxID=995050 RepID=A0A846QN64_9BACT|nr:phosphate/phosphite/phosphonate ABC transporter substrate-binding protein [Desulfobaculum xiamenense]NJB67703.1 phosphonate transport system substrate-binding protein [Desulfobaculum xiamenense]